MDPLASLRALHQAGRPVRGLDLTGADLAGVVLGKLRADGVPFVGADLTGLSLAQARLTSCDFTRATLAETDFSGATLRLCTLDGARATRARFDGARVEDGTAAGADLAGASLRGARLSESDWSRAGLRGAMLDEAEGEGVGFRGADLAGASLLRARFPYADFRGADLTGTDLAGADVHGADFRGAVLDGVHWGTADVRGARFDEDAQDGPAAPEGAAGAADPAAADALADAWEQLLSGSHTPGASGDARIQAGWRALAAAIEARPGDTETGGDLGAAVQSILDGTGGGALPTELEGLIERMIGPLQAGGEAPPGEWQHVLRTLFPTLDLDDEGALERLAAALAPVLPPRRELPSDEPQSTP